MHAVVPDAIYEAFYSLTDSQQQARARAWGSARGGGACVACLRSARVMGRVGLLRMTHAVLLPARSLHSRRASTHGHTRTHANAHAHRRQITSYIFDVVRAIVPRIKLDDVFTVRVCVCVCVRACVCVCV